MKNNSPGPQLTATTFIYGLVDPRTNELRYVGKANNPESRHRDHAKDLKINTHKTRWIKRLLEEGVPPSLIILEEVALSEWQESERWWIMYTKSLGARLTNGTSGGDGVQNPSQETINKLKAYIATPETRLKISLANKGQTSPNKGKTYSEEYRLKLSIAHMGRIRPPEECAAISKRMKENHPFKGKTHSEETKAKISLSSKNRKYSQETISKRKESRAGFYSWAPVF